MKIYDFAGAPNAARVRIVLAAKGLDRSISSGLISSGRSKKVMPIWPRIRSGKFRCSNSMTAR